ncbi:interferon-induced protein 44-like isoform X1 [Hemicordylus capensis]|uniref:interferon-induced protein 44-like isoform X1 n=2 Tax=Hemicordylus capensis TaxID=884348 RepID=UPI0023037B29|nr:interferon-induced protein 44-like isoform X1 [Hemicordylus capensis]XP_053105668.1 interferon-induced protein 44-like isoform X1 [Hemicordylus capensis]
MAEGKSRLTREEQQQLQHLLGCKHISLLYKASIHGYAAQTFHNICNRQGPTVVVAYSTSGYIFGGFTAHSYTSSGAYINDDRAFLFRLKGKECNPLKIPVNVSENAVCDNAAHGPYFGAGSLIFLSQNRAEVATDASIATYSFRAEDLHGNDQRLLECEVYRVDDVGPFMESPWRKIGWTAGERNKLMEEITTYKPSLKSVPQVRILFLGPVGAGKSSFFNSVNSTFRGYVISQATAGSDAKSVTTQYRTYGVKYGSNGKLLPFLFCDTMGLEEKQGAGLEMNDVSSILKGHVPDRYQFNPSAAMQPNVPGYIKNPSLKDQIHCVVIVLDGSKVEILPEELEKKLREIRRQSKQANEFDVPQLVILTKVDEICPSLLEDISYVYKSKVVEKQMQLTAERLGIPLSQIVPVKNYYSELDLRDDVDILILMAVRQMLRLSESYLDNFPLDESSVVNAKERKMNNLSE